MEFKDVFRELRKARGYSQVVIAEKLNLSKSLIGAYETGDRVPSFKTLEDIADFFNVDIDYLIGRDVKSSYYLDPEAATIAQELYERPDLKVLFKATRNVSPEDIAVVKSMVDALARKED